MKSGKRKFDNGLTIIYVYPDNGKSVIQMHFGFNGVYNKRANASLDDTLSAIRGIRADLLQFEYWLRENGTPDSIVGTTDTNFLVNLLRDSGVVITQDVEGGAREFRIDEPTMHISEIFDSINNTLNKLEDRVIEINKTKEGSRQVLK